MAVPMLPGVWAADLLNETFDTSDGGFVQEATGNTPIPAVYNAGAGTWSIEGDDAGPATNTLTSPIINNPSNAGIQISFEHRYSIEIDWDGCGLQVSVDGGDFVNVPSSAFTQNGYTNPAPLIGNHVLGGLDGFNGDSLGYYDPAFITSVADIGGLAAGSTIQVRFVGAWDEGSRGPGIPNWEINSIRVETLPDSDGDGMPDTYETEKAFDPNDGADAAGDADSDTISNLDEYLRGLDPTNEDTDSDGLKDGTETNSGNYVNADDTGTDPLNPDSDGDGLLDGAENPNLPFVDESQAGTDPLTTDSDGDGFDDGLETLLSTSNPTNSASRPLRSGLLDILAFWDFNDDSDPTKASDLIKGFEGNLLGSTVYTADGTGRSGNAGDKAIDMGFATQGGTGVVVELGEVINIASQQNQFAVSFWQKLNGVVNSTSFRGISPSSPNAQRGLSGHATWGDGNIYFDTAGCCDAVSQRINGPGSDITVLDSWKHIVFQKNGDAKEVWVDGTLILSGNNTAPLPSDFNRLFIGTDNQGNNIAGQLDDFAFFADALNAEEIAALAAGDDPRSLVPANDDSDLDGMPDVYEIANGLNPAVNDADADLDNDGLSNINEFIAATDPNNEDSDDDGLKDGVETNTGVYVDASNTGTDPLNGDSDGDTLSDGIENPDLPFVDASQPGTNPNLADSDDDTYGDSIELSLGSNPTSSDSIPDTLKLLAYYDFNGQTKDQAGNTPDVALQGGAVLTSEGNGASGTAGDEALDLGFAGDGSAGTVPPGSHFDLINSNNSVAVSFWQFNKGFANSSAFWLFAPTAGGNQRGFQAHTPWSNGTVYLDVAGCCNPNQRLTVGGAALENQWQHFVFQRTIGGDLEIWIDGVRAAQSTGNVDLIELDGSFNIGAEGASFNNSFSGLIDDFAVYSSALNGDQVAQLAGGATPPELFGSLAELEITAISYNQEADQTTLTWNSRNNRVYSVDFSTDLQTWEEVTDDVGSQGETTTLKLPALNRDEKTFFRVREVN